MTRAAFLTAVAVAALAAGGALWWVTLPKIDASGASDIAPGALWAATFADTRGTTHSLGELQGRIVVVNFWATWCAPCREEMPGFTRLSERWKAKGVRFVGLANDDPAKVEQFGHDLAISYPLWVGGESVGELSRRLGNRLGVLPHTVILDPTGAVLDTRVGPYPEARMEEKLQVLSGKST